MAPYRPLTEDEIRALNRKQFLDRLVEVTHHWEDRRRGRISGGARQAEADFIDLRNRYVVDEFMDKAVYRFATEADAVLAEQGPDYWLTRMDGSEARPPRRVQRSRVRGARLPYGCRVVTRPGIYGNPVGTVDGDYSLPGVRFRDYLVRRARLPQIPQPYLYPTDGQIVRDLGYWDLACWCPLTDRTGDHCHADVLLWVAAGQSAAGYWDHQTSDTY